MITWNWSLRACKCWWLFLSILAPVFSMIIKLTRPNASKIILWLVCNKFVMPRGIALPIIVYFAGCISHTSSFIVGLGSERIGNQEPKQAARRQKQPMWPVLLVAICRCCCLRMIIVFRALLHPRVRFALCRKTDSRFCDSAVQHVRVAQIVTMMVASWWLARSSQGLLIYDTGVASGSFETKACIPDIQYWKYLLHDLLLRFTKIFLLASPCCRERRSSVGSAIYLPSDFIAHFCIGKNSADRSIAIPFSSGWHATWQILITIPDSADV